MGFTIETLRKFSIEELAAEVVKAFENRTDFWQLSGMLCVLLQRSKLRPLVQLGFEIWEVGHAIESAADEFEKRERVRSLVRGLLL